MKDYENENAIFPKLHRRNSSCIDSESLKVSNNLPNLLQKRSKKINFGRKITQEMK